MQVFNARTQQNENVTWSVDSNNDIVATFDDGRFLKFPAGTSQEDLQRLVTEHESANTGHEVITPEMEAAAAAERQASQDLVDQLNGEQGQEEGVKNNAPDNTGSESAN